MLPEHISDISQMGKKKTVTQYKAKAPPGAPNWAPLCTCAHWPPGTSAAFLIEMNVGLVGGGEALSFNPFVCSFS